jgi:hypothetical protein
MSAPLLPYFGFNNVGFFAPNANTVFVLGNDGNLWNTPGPFDYFIPNANRVLVDQNVLAFQVLDDSKTVFTLRFDKTLWQCGYYGEDFGSSLGVPVDADVAGFQALDKTTVYVLRTDGSLWLISITELGLPDLEKIRLVQSNVADFQVAVLGDIVTTVVLGTDGNLWHPAVGPFPAYIIVPDVVDFQAVYNQDGSPAFFVLQPGGNLGYCPELFSYQNLIPVDTNVSQFQAVDDQTVYVLGEDNNLWLIPGPFGIPNPSRAQVDGSVQGFQAMDPQVMLIPGVYVLGNDNNLWFTPGPFVPNRPIPYPMRGQVDGNVAAFQALDSGTVFVAGTDGNLWYTPGFFLPGLPIPNPNRGQVDGNVAGANELSYFSPQQGGTFPPLPYYWR